MNALVTGIAAFFIAALGTLFPHDVVYVPALFSVIVAGGYVGGTIFSLQSEGVYDLRIRETRAISSLREARLGGIWAYGLVGIPAGAIALLIAGRMIGVNDSAVAELLSSTAGSVASVRRMAICLGVFAVTVVGGLTVALRTRAPADDHFRRAVALWNLGCYVALLGKGESVEAVIDALDEALRNAPQFRESLGSGVLDQDLASLVGNPLFDEWRRATLARRGSR